ncbi:MAG: putative DNA binding domain-containing protein [Betaproteobacteria bacterium]|nr:putative DNA binding domain-containing protein [Betaproteobacteria bacterium]
MKRAQPPAEPDRLPQPLWAAADAAPARLPADWVRGLLAQAHECEWVEFKQDNDNPEQMAEYACALANGAAWAGQPHGYLVWGIRDGSREWVGTAFRPERARKGNEDLIFWLNVVFRGQTEVEFFEAEEGPRRAVVLRVQAAVGRPVRYAGEQWMRVRGAKVRLRDYPQIEHELLDRLARRHFEHRVAAEGWPEEVVWTALDVPAWFVACREPVPANRTEALAMLAERGLLAQRPDGRWNVFNLGALLLGRELRRFGALARKALRVVIYRGADASAQAEELPLGERGYALVLDEALRALLLRLPADEVVAGARRERREHYPELAVRELIVNALVHQDFAVRGAGPVVEVFEGRIDVTNPGRPLVAVERLIDWPAQSRNEALARAMRLLRFCEERGSGIDRVVAGAEARLLPAPSFEVLAGKSEEGAADFMRARLFGPRTFAQMSVEDRLRAAYQHACLSYQRGERLTNASLRARLGLDAAQVAQVSRLIGQARQRGLLRAADDAERSYVPGWVSPGPGRAET